ncbi:MAG: hypothetical protein ABI323_03525 [Solirubrobacteraceae bacterium]
MSSNQARWLIFALVTAAVSLASTAVASAATAPAATTAPASSITASGATLNGIVNAHKTPTTYYFQYGTTTAYGLTTPVANANGNVAKAVKASLTGLAASTTYHFRLLASNSAGIADGKDATFTTQPAGVGTPSNHSVSIEALPVKITWGKSTTISGTVTGPLRGGRRATLKATSYPYSGAFTDTGQTTRTSASGTYSFTVSPGESTRYEVTLATKVPLTSAVVQVGVRVKVIIHMSTLHPHVGQLVRFSGTITPAHNGRYAQIQRRTSTGAWKTVASTRLRPGGTVNGVAVSHYSRKIRIRHSGTYRVRVNPRDGNHLVGTSATRRAIIR